MDRYLVRDLVDKICNAKIPYIVFTCEGKYNPEIGVFYLSPTCKVGNNADGEIVIRLN